jgi:hypothetical protein
MLAQKRGNSGRAEVYGSLCSSCSNPPTLLSGSAQFQQEIQLNVSNRTARGTLSPHFPAAVLTKRIYCRLHLTKPSQRNCHAIHPCLRRTLALSQHSTSSILIFLALLVPTSYGKSFNGYNPLRSWNTSNAQHLRQPHSQSTLNTQQLRSLQLNIVTALF